MKQHERINKEAVLQQAQGRWGDILGALCPPLQPALDRNGRHVPCPVHGGKDGFRVFRDVDETGGSVCNTCGIHANGLSTLMWANDWGFLDALEAVSAWLSFGITSSASVKKSRLPTDAEDTEKLRQAMNRVWSVSLPLSHQKAEPARLYLARRGIATRLPETLRFHPELAYFDGEQKIGQFPALLAPVLGQEGNPVTLHRTYLTPDGQKAPVEAPKKLMRYPKERKIVGGAIQLFAPQEILAVAEGLETALAVREGMKMPVWCAVNAHLLEHFMPPEGVRRVLVFADKDRPTAQHPQGHGQEASRHLVQRLWAKGLYASAIVPAGEIPVGQKSLDWLDVLRQHGRKAFPTLQSVERVLRRAA